MSLPPGVHVILGDSAAGIFRRVFSPRPRERLVIDLDVVSCGPTPHCDDLDAWCDMRRAYWQSLVRDVEGAPNFRSVHGGLLGASERLRDAERVTIWAATGLNEQLFIAHVLHRAEQWAVDASKLYIVQFERRSDAIARVMGLASSTRNAWVRIPSPCRSHRPP